MCVMLSGLETAHGTGGNNAFHIPQPLLASDTKRDVALQELTSAMSWYRLPRLYQLVQRP
jgi:hypothetical protein